ncbi:hypothetical protein [Cyanothece sp. BG0011]|uniref:hypothetical protein n=1 Tax=Cyanothece sp. BG0011 TaxID=2082950 RepID=UPI000D1F6725|nr:hypothetical protein [Cyanothece sp. BG0011]
MTQEWINVTGIITKGHQVASGMAKNSPYPQGTIEMQTPFFKELGLDIAAFFPGTLNINIRPYKFKLYNPQYTFETVKWNPNSPSETFSFSCCQIFYQQTQYTGLIYYPHPETKPTHFQDDSTLEILTQPLDGIQYGQSMQLNLNPKEIDIFSD